VCGDIDPSRRPIFPRSNAIAPPLRLPEPPRPGPRRGDGGTKVSCKRFSLATFVSNRCAEASGAPTRPDVVLRSGSSCPPPMAVAQSNSSRVPTTSYRLAALSGRRGPCGGRCTGCRERRLVGRSSRVPRCRRRRGRVGWRWRSRRCVRPAEYPGWARSRGARPAARPAPLVRGWRRAPRRALGPVAAGPHWCRG
jgi:hypothetical protein